jgi:anti-anti-sigma regulatory factor
MTDSLVAYAEMAPTLQVELATRGTTCRLILCGILCGATLPALEAQVDQVGCIPCEEVVVDVRGLTKVDAVGANALLDLYYYVVARGGEFRLTTSAPDVEAALRAVGGTDIPLEAA